MSANFNPVMECEQMKPTKGTVSTPMPTHYSAANGSNELTVTKVEGPYDAKGSLVESVELGNIYYYYATLNEDVNSIQLSQIKWAVSYDSDNFEKQYYLFSGKEVENDKIKISIAIGTTDKIKQKITESFRIYAYTNINPNSTIYVDVNVGSIYTIIFSGMKEWGQLQTGMATKNIRLTEEELDKGLDWIGKNNVAIMKDMGEDTIKAFYEKGPLGVKNVLSNKDDIERKVISNFYNGTLDKISFDENSEQAKGLNDLASFQEYFNNYLNAIEQLINMGEIVTAKAENIIEAFGEGAPYPNFSNISEIASHDYYGFMGGTQRIKVELIIEHWTLEDRKAVDFYKVYTKMYIGDWYGADWGDVNGSTSKLKGNVYSLNAFFWLQHHYGCHPFETEIIYQSENKIERIQ